MATPGGTELREARQAAVHALFIAEPSRYHFAKGMSRRDGLSKRAGGPLGGARRGGSKRGAAHMGAATRSEEIERLRDAVRVARTAFAEAGAAYTKVAELGGTSSETMVPVAGTRLRKAKQDMDVLVARLRELTNKDLKSLRDQAHRAKKKRKRAGDAEASSDGGHLEHVRERRAAAGPARRSRGVPAGVVGGTVADDSAWSPAEGGADVDKDEVPMETTTTNTADDKAVAGGDEEGAADKANPAVGMPAQPKAGDEHEGSVDEADKVVPMEVTVRGNEEEAAELELPGVVAADGAPVEASDGGDGAGPVVEDLHVAVSAAAKMCQLRAAPGCTGGDVEELTACRSDASEIELHVCLKCHQESRPKLPAGKCSNPRCSKAGNAERACRKCNKLVHEYTSGCSVFFEGQGATGDVTLCVACCATAMALSPQ
jgi:hypothetical protein